MCERSWRTRAHHAWPLRAPCVPRQSNEALKQQVEVLAAYQQQDAARMAAIEELKEKINAQVAGGVGRPVDGVERDKGAALLAAHADTWFFMQTTARRRH